MSTKRNLAKNKVPEIPVLQEQTNNVAPELKMALRELFEVDEASERAKIEAMWERARMIAGLGKKEFCADKEGGAVHPFDVAADLLQMSGSYRDVLLQFFHAVPNREALEKITSLRMKCGRCLTWGHLQLLLRFFPSAGGVSRTQFDHWLQRALDENLTVAQLDRAIAEHLRGDRQPKRAGTRPIPVPRTFDKRCEKLREHVDKLSLHLQQVYVSRENGVLASLEEIPPSVVAKREAE